LSVCLSWVGVRFSVGLRVRVRARVRV
jgi:hypothetical protein